MLFYNHQAQESFFLITFSFWSLSIIVSGCSLLVSALLPQNEQERNYFSRDRLIGFTGTKRLCLSSQSNRTPSSGSVARWKNKLIGIKVVMLCNKNFLKACQTSLPRYWSCQEKVTDTSFPDLFDFVCKIYYRLGPENLGWRIFVVTILFLNTERFSQHPVLTLL